MPVATGELEARLSALEAKLGVSSSSLTAQNDNISSRLDSIQSTIETQTTSQFRETWKESQKLFRELNPGMALTHQQQPLLYRRQEVLAASGSLKQDMDELGKILHLVMTSQQAKQQKTTLREDQVTQAPILTSMSISPEDERRLDDLRLTLTDLNTRTQTLMASMDHMMECYHTAMTAASEKFILADESISLRESK